MLGRASAGRAFKPADCFRFGCFCLLSVGGFCFVPPPPQPAPLGLHQASLNTTHSRNQTHSLAPVVSLSADAEADSDKGGMDYVVGMTLRQRINAAMALLDHVAARTDLAFAQTHGSDSRVRSKSNQNRWGDGYSAVAKRTASVCTRLRKLVKSVYKERLDDADAIRATLASDGVDICDVHREAGVVVSEARAELKRERKLLHGRKRKQYVLQGGGVSAQSQERKQRAATKREINAIMERPVAGAIASVTTGKGDAAEVLTGAEEVAAECCSWSERRMSTMQPKWFRRLDLAVGHVVWAVDNDAVRGGKVSTIDNDGRYDVVTDEGFTLSGVAREKLCLKWQPAVRLTAPAAAVGQGDTMIGQVSGGDQASSVGGTEVGRQGHVLSVEEVMQFATAAEIGDIDTALMFRRSPEGLRVDSGLRQGH